MLGDPKGTCGDIKCGRYSMTLAEFSKLRGERWGHGFNSKLGKAVKKLCRELYGKVPPSRRRSIAWRNPLPEYPCGLIEQAYRELRASGYPLGERPKRTTPLNPG